VTVTDVGFYGPYGGRYVPETLVPALDELERGWREVAADPSYREELDALGRTYVGRPTPLYRTERLAEGRRIYLKREDLCHTGAHKINNAVGQALLARRLGKHRIVAETGAGQHGVAAATVALRARVRRLHGRRGHAPPAPQRRADAPPRG
jgi:tryptophan synthase beta chain